jgi:hypothetical protein
LGESRVTGPKRLADPGNQPHPQENGGCNARQVVT